MPGYTPDWAESSGREVLLGAAQTWLLPRDGVLAPGDVILFRMREAGVAKHLGICGETGERTTFIHAYSEHGVVESPLSGPWERRIVALFAFPAGEK
jgi:NlpC/P60 family putative phage cell wall peptidase